MHPQALRMLVAGSMAFATGRLDPGWRNNEGVCVPQRDLDVFLEGARMGSGKMRRGVGCIEMKLHASGFSPVFGG